MSEEKEGLQFPIPGAASCPGCGCEERIGQRYIRELKEKGKLSDKAFPQESLAFPVPIFDPTHMPLAAHFNIPVLQVCFDVCKECKLLYCTGVQMTEQPAEIQPLGPQQPGADFRGGRQFPY